MKLTTHSEYGLLALLYICRSKSKDPIPMSEIAAAQELPMKYMEHLMQAMCRAGYLTSSRGKYGGYLLNRPAKDITVAEVVRLFDGALAPSESVSRYFYKPTPIEREKKLLALMREIRDHVAKKLERTTIADVC